MTRILWALAGLFLAVWAVCVWLGFRSMDKSLLDQARRISPRFSVPPPCMKRTWPSGFSEVDCPAGVIPDGFYYGFPTAYKTATINYDEVTN